MSVKLITITPDAEPTMAYIARVSNPSNQNNDDYVRLLKYCINHGHWSVFEHAHMTIEINTTRAIAAQILRHRSFTFQEFSQRYADFSAMNVDIEVPDLRLKDVKNRQNSIKTNQDFSEIKTRIKKHFDESIKLYNMMVDKGIATECARGILPLSTPTRLYMTGNIRNWIHYIQLRTANGTQLEHMAIANACKVIFIEQLPALSLALGWF